MKVEREESGNLSITYDGSVLSVVSLVVFVIATGWLAIEYATNGPDTERFQGLIGASVIFLLMGIVIWEKASFKFDVGRKELRWRKGRYFRYRSGRLHFSEIEAIILGSPVGDEGVPSIRIELITKKEKLSVTDSYKSYRDNFAENLTSELTKLVGLKVNATPEELAVKLNELGRVFEAVKVLTKESGMTVTEAKKYLDK